MFVRSKRIKGNQYYYVCESVRKDGKVQQQVRNYLGSYHNAERQLKILYQGDILSRLVQQLNKLHRKRNA